MLLEKLKNARDGRQLHEQSGPAWGVALRWVCAGHDVLDQCEQRFFSRHDFQRLYPGFPPGDGSSHGNHYASDLREHGLEFWRALQSAHGWLDDVIPPVMIGETFPEKCALIIGKGEHLHGEFAFSARFGPEQRFQRRARWLLA